MLKLITVIHSILEIECCFINRQVNVALIGVFSEYVLVPLLHNIQFDSETISLNSSNHCHTE